MKTSPLSLTSHATRQEPATGPGDTTLHHQIVDTRQAAECVTTLTEAEVKAGKLITAFLRKAVASQAYGAMFAHGKHFAKAGQSLPKQDKYGFNALQHLGDLSRKNLADIAAKVGPLSPAEQALAEKITSTSWNFRHQSNAPLETGNTLSISSVARLSKEHQDIKKQALQEGKTYLGHSFKPEYEALHHTGFVFFGVEFAGASKDHPPLNTLHQFNDYGANAYLISDTLPACQQGYLTLTDHFENQIPPQTDTELGERFPKAARQIRRTVHTEGLKFMAPVFAFDDMKEAMALHMIDFLRNCTDDKFKQYVLSDAINSGAALDEVLNCVFQAEFHLPHLLSTQDYAKYTHRPMTMEDIIDGGNIPALEERVHSKADAVTFMWAAIKKGNGSIVDYLLKNWTFSAEDFAECPDHENLIVALTYQGSSPYILEQFLEHKLIDANASYEKWGRHHTLLDEATSWNNDAMVKIVLDHGATPAVSAESEKLRALLAELQAPRQ